MSKLASKNQTTYWESSSALFGFISVFATFELLWSMFPVPVLHVFTVNIVDILKSLCITSGVQSWTILKPCLSLFLPDWIPAPTVTLSARHSCPTPSSAGFMCVRVGMDCACLLTQWDHSVQLAPRFITSICFLWADPSCDKITLEHLGKASAWFGSCCVPSSVLLPTHVEAQCAAVHTVTLLNVWTPFFFLYQYSFTVQYVSELTH